MSNEWSREPVAVSMGELISPDDSLALRRRVLTYMMYVSLGYSHAMPTASAYVSRSALIIMHAVTTQPSREIPPTYTPRVMSAPACELMNSRSFYSILLTGQTGWALVNSTAASVA